MRLEERRPELEETLLTQIHAANAFDEADLGEYAAGLPGTVSALVDCCRGLLAQGVTSSQIPPELMTQARLAARLNIGLEVLQQHCFSGYTLVNDVISGEATRLVQIGPSEVHHLQRDLATHFNCVLSLIGDEYAHEVDRVRGSNETKMATHIRGLLAGEPVGAGAVDYEFDGWHVGVVITGVEIEKYLARIARELDQRLLTLSVAPDEIWAWFGGRKKLRSIDLQQLALQRMPPDLVMTIGEAGNGISGWRASHKQALATIPIAKKRNERIVRYANHALLASILRDDLLIRSLRQIYLSPLEEGRGGGVRLRRTLQAYFATDGQISSTAALLGVSRKTVSNHLGSAEELIGKSLASCLPDIAAALMLDEILPMEGDNLRKSPSH